ncbi:ABC transporter permease [Geochorda subterranea]|uniref:ABC transporter permease n=1 Tax=Geochorda subterranea TaxID=3109564 RepID=A0ABZ1BRD9_9FIRM|nr:ABC transporter permease [Limnochorda sp. LNt]WRP15248.1 ABC transporter permease [Limnochorda sp. LNt]
MNGTVIRAFARQFARNKPGVAGIVIIIAFLVMALLAPWISPYDPGQMNLLARNKGPTIDHWFGNDEMGRDILSRIIFGARVSLLSAIGAVSIATLLGVPLGLLAGYVGGWTDSLIMRVMDVLLSFPAFLLALGLAAAMEPGLVNAVLAVGIARTPQFVRMVRGLTLSARERDFIQSARAIGVAESVIVSKHLLPNIMGPIVVQATLHVATSILTITGLGFLGIGMDPRTPEWGAMLSSGFSYLRVAPHMSVFPGVFIVLAVLGFNLAGDALRDALDPRMKRYLTANQ